MKKIDTSAWGEFRLDELFTVVKGSRLTTAERLPGDIPYVGASQFNNGITHYIGNDEHVHPGGALTVCYNGPVGTTFLQNESFWATDDVNVLRLRVSGVADEALLFIAPIIERMGSKHAYIDKWKMSDMAATVIRLPQTPSGTPDWEYMETTMKRMLARQTANLDILQQLDDGCE